MKLLNTVALPNSLIAQATDYVAIYVGDTIKVYKKNPSTNGLVEEATSYKISGVLELKISENGLYIVAKTDTQLIRCFHGTQAAFTINSHFDISNSGLIVHASYSTNAVQLVADATTNITATLTSNDRVCCGKTKYIVYSATRYLTAAYTDVVFVTTTPASAILEIFHCGNDKFAVFFADGTASFLGMTRTPDAKLPRKGFRRFGKHIGFTDYKNEYVNAIGGPISDGVMLRKFVRDLPPSAGPLWGKYLMLIPGNGLDGTGLDVKNGLAPNNTTGVVIVDDAPYGATGKSLKFNGTTSVLQTAHSDATNFGASDFTIEFDVRMDVDKTVDLICKGGGYLVAWATFIIQAIGGVKSFTFAASTSNTKYEAGSTDTNGWGSWEVGVWTRIAITRQGSTIYCFQDGILQRTYPISGALYNSSPRGLHIGHGRQNNWDTGAIYSVLNGLLHGISFLNYAKYTANHFVETLPIGRRAAGDPIAVQTLTIGATPVYRFDDLSYEFFNASNARFGYVNSEKKTKIFLITQSLGASTNFSSMTGPIKGQDLVWAIQNNLNSSYDGYYLAVGCFKSDGTVVWQQRLKFSSSTDAFSSGRALLTAEAVPKLYAFATVSSGTVLRFLKYDANNGANRVTRDVSLNSGALGIVGSVAYKQNICVATSNYETANSRLRMNITLLGPELTLIRNQVIYYPAALLTTTNSVVNVGSVLYRNCAVFAFPISTTSEANTRIMISSLNLETYEVRSRILTLSGATSLGNNSYTKLFVVGDTLLVQQAVRLTSGGSIYYVLSAIEGFLDTTTPVVSWKKLLSIDARAIEDDGTNATFSFLNTRVTFPSADIVDIDFSVTLGGRDITWEPSTQGSSITTPAGTTTTTTTPTLASYSATTATGSHYSLSEMEASDITESTILID